jgi:MYXO-CTERM domain-containing protein
VSVVFSLLNLLSACAPTPGDSAGLQAPSKQHKRSQGALSGGVYRNALTEILGGFDEDPGFGFLITGAGDLNGDGYDEVIVSDPHLGSNGYHWVFNGSSAGPSTDQDLLIEGEYGAETWAPIILSADLDSDGYDDLILGERGAITGSLHTHALRWGSASGVAETLDALTAGIAWFYSSDSYPTGALDLCDVDGDGVPEVVGVDRVSGIVVLETSSSGVDTSNSTYTPSSVLDVDSLDCAGDVDGDGYEDVILGDFDLGSAELMYGGSAGLSSAWTQSSSSGVPKYGSQVLGLGDVNGDGYDDVAVGHKAYGYVELFLGASGGLGSSPDQTYVGSLPGHSQQIAALGDVNGDGVDDLGLLEPKYGVYGTKALGQVTVHLGASGGPSTTADASYQGDPSVGIGELAGVGDVDGDGYDDLGIGMDGIFAGVLTGAASLSLTLDHEWEAEDWYDDLGDSLAGGDFDGDGFGDLVYALQDGDLGVSFGGSAGIGQTPDELLAAADFGVSSLTEDLFGLGDLDGDGYDDLLVFDATSLLVVFGGSTLGGSTQSFSSTTPSITSWTSEKGREAQAGDFDGDGYLDVAYNEDLGSGQGQVVVRLGSSSGLGTAHLTVSGSASAQLLGADLTVADFNADGYDDLLLLADESGSTLGTTGTALYFYAGSSSGLSGSPTLLDAGTNCIFLETIGDADGDGYPDALCSNATRSTQLFDGGASGATVGSAGPTTRAYYSALDVVSLGDVDDDGYADFGMIASFSGTLDLYRGSSAGPEVSYAWAWSCGEFATVSDVVADQDLDGDGLVDLALTIRGSAGVRGRLMVFPGGTDTDGDGVIDVEDCDSTDASVGTGIWYLDSDGDGFGDEAEEVESCTAPTGHVADATDCDDSSAGVYPGAIEVCDAKQTDEDCDGNADDFDISVVGQTTWYLDSDRDGYGVSSTTVEFCQVPMGYAAVAGDCDDANRSINPGGSEVCDSADADEDCDGLADDADSSATGQQPAYTDTDGDGFGDTSSLTRVCDLGSGQVWDGGDCDEGDSAIHPGAVEVCDTLGTDEDCDGLADDADSSVIGTTAWYPDVDGDGFGDTSSPVQQCEALGLIATPGDCDDGDSAVHPDADELCAGVGLDEDCDGSVDEADAVDLNDWYLDSDLDGFGDSGVSLQQCLAPSGYVSDATDCDDDKAWVYPGAIEICDAEDLDEDCDGLSGNADLEGALGLVLFHLDADLDGFGDPESTTWLCEVEPGVVADDGDCDDTRADVNPEGVEVCDPEDVDEDCDGASDDLDLDGAQGKTAVYLDGDGDGYGYGSAQDFCDPPEGWSSQDGDCDDGDSGAYPGAEEIRKDGIDQDCDGEDQVRRGCSSAPGSTLPVPWLLGGLVLLLRRRRQVA